ncbi:MAG: YbjQ family protein [Bacteroidales bacterium]|nr:YbjQ family protein [Bacteroidales bacterium]
MQKIITTSTDTIEGAVVEKYIDVISTNVVVGTNFFSDIGAAITDLFGGLSDTYQDKLQKIYKIGIDKLKTKASYLGANAIIGIKIDFDEISGKGKSMFMISTFGTAVKIRVSEKDNHLTVSETDSIVGLDSLEQEFNKRTIQGKVIAKNLPTQEDWQFLFNSPISEIAPIILELYFERLNQDQSMLNETEKLLMTNTPSFFRNLDENQAIEILYENIIEKPKSCTKIIESNNLFSAKKIIDLIKKGEISIAINCLLINKNYYTKDDLKLMEEIVVLFENLEDLGKIEMVKGVLSKAKEKYICPKGHTNNTEIEYCETYGCGKNIKGLEKNQVEIINKFKTKTDSLKSILTKN